MISTVRKKGYTNHSKDVCRQYNPSNISFLNRFIATICYSNVKSIVKTYEKVESIQKNLLI